MILPGERIFFGIPCQDRRIDCDCAIAIFKMVHKYGGQTYFHMGISDIALARNYVIHRFLQSDCDWLMMVDSDIIFSEQDWDYLWEEQIKCDSNPHGYAEDIVTAPYGRKIPGVRPTGFGLGFTRVHRRVFAKMDELKKPDGDAFIERYYIDSDMYGHYFPVGVSGDSRWIGEDRGFFTLAQMADCTYRMENRTRLQHVGFFIYGFPNQDNGAKFWTHEPPLKTVLSACGRGEHSFDDAGVCVECGESDSRPIVVM